MFQRKPSRRTRKGRTPAIRQFTRDLNFEPLETRALLAAVIGTETLTPFTITGNVGEKPESKIWKNDGHWFGVFSDSSAAYVWRLDGQNWTKTIKISSLKGLQVDAKADGDVTHVLFKNKLASQLVSLQYVSGAEPTYKLWDDRPTPVTVPLSSDVEAATIDLDSTGRMWVAYDNSSKIEVRYSDSPYGTWSNPVVLASNVLNSSKGDIAALTAIPNGTVGVLWSNQTTGHYGFRTHVDGTDPTVWTNDEIPASQSELDIPDGFPDAHINLAVGSNSTVYAAIKTAYHPIGTPEMGILVRRPNGVWDDFHEVEVLDGTRPIVQLNEVANTLIFSYDNDTEWVYHECNATTIACSGPNILLTDGDQGTSTKQIVTNDLVILTSGKTSGGKVWGGLLKFNNENTAPHVNAGPDQSIFETQSVSLNGSVSDDGLPIAPAVLTTSWTKISGPGDVTFADDTTRKTTATFSLEGTYELELGADDGDLTAYDSITITVKPTPPNEGPSVSAGDDFAIGIAETATLHGTVSDDGLPFVPGFVTTEWIVVDGPGSVDFGDASALETTALFGEVGTYILGLTASDGDLTESAAIVIDVQPLPPNKAPVVNAGTDKPAVKGSPVTLTGSFTDDNLPVAAALTSATWSVVSGPGDVEFADDSKLQTSATFSKAGTYELELAVDDTELAGTDTVIITVSDQPPVTKSFQDGVFPTKSYKGTIDTKLLSDNNKKNFGKDKRLENNGKPDHTSLLQWNVSEIPTGATVLGASFTVNVENTSKNSYKVYEVLKNWVEGEATFLLSKKNTPWTTPGAASVDNDRGSTVLGTISAPKKGLVTVELNAAGVAVVQEWISDPSSNHGLVIQDFTDTLKDDLDFTSSEGSKTTTRPKLNIQYMPPSSPLVSPLRTSAIKNVDNPFDVNADAHVTPMDALLVINSLNGEHPEGEQGAPSTGLFLDVSGDGNITPLDALIVINKLNEPAPTADEGARANTEDLLVLTTGSQSSLLGSVDLTSSPNSSDEERHDADCALMSLISANLSDIDPASCESTSLDEVLTTDLDQFLENATVNELASDDSHSEFFASLGIDS